MFYQRWTYLAVFIVLVCCSLGLPLPEDVPLLTGGFLVFQGLAKLYIMIPVGFVGVLAGDFVLFSMGRRFGHRIVQHPVMRRVVNPRRLLLAEKLFGRHGLKIVFVGRFLPGLRAMIFIAAGVLRVPFWKFALVNGSAACISVPTLIMLGAFFGQNLDRVQRDVRMATHLLVLIMMMAALVLGAYYFHRRQRRLMLEEAVPDIDAETLSHTPPAAEPQNRSRP